MHQSSLVHKLWTIVLGNPPHGVCMGAAAISREHRTCVLDIAGHITLIIKLKQVIQSSGKPPERDGVHESCNGDHAHQWGDSSRL